MIQNEKYKQMQDIVARFEASEKIGFKSIIPSMLPDKAPAVYAISNLYTGETLYVGRTKNIRRRIYTNHLMGPLTNARLKKYLIEDINEPSITDIESAKSYIKNNCYVQYIIEPDTRIRGQIEGLLSFLLDVRYMHEEH